MHRDLRPTCDPRPQGMPQVVERDLLLQLLHEVGPLRPWTNERHVSAEHVDQLGQLVEPQLAQKSADSSYPGITLRCPHWPARGFGICPHGTELENFEFLAILAHAHLPIERS